MPAGDLHATALFTAIVALLTGGTTATAVDVASRLLASTMKAPTGGGASGGEDRGGLLITTLDGELHGFGVDGSHNFRYSLGAPLIDVDLAPRALAPLDDDPLGEETQLMAALDGTLFLAMGDRKTHASVRDMVDKSPFKVRAFPGVHFTGERQSRVHTIEIPAGLVGGASPSDGGGDDVGEQEVVREPEADGVGRDGGAEGRKNAEDVVAGRVVWQQPSSRRNGGVDAVRKLRFGTTRWSVSAVDDDSNMEQWSFTFREISSLTPRANSSDMLELWRGRVDLKERSATLRKSYQRGGACSADAADVDGLSGGCQVEAGCVSRNDRGADDIPGCQQRERTLTFDSEVLAAFVFSSVDDEPGVLELELIGHAAPTLAPIGSNWRPSVPLLPSPFRSGEAMRKRMLVDLVDSQNVFGEADADRSAGYLPKSWANSSPTQEESDPQCSARGRIVTSSYRFEFFFGFLVAVAAWVLLSARRKRRRAESGLQLPVSAHRGISAGGCSDSRFDTNGVESGTEKDVEVPSNTPQAAASPAATTPTDDVRRGASKREAQHEAQVWGGSPQVDAAAAAPSLVGPTAAALSPSMGCPLPAPSLVPPGTTLSISMRNGNFAATFADPAFLGAGAFGAVYQGRHRLDGASYAVKLVPIAGGLAEDEDIRHRQDFREVTNLQRINDMRHVVRYFTCWCEEPQCLPVAVPGSALPVLSLPDRCNAAAFLRPWQRLASSSLGGASSAVGAGGEQLSASEQLSVRFVGPPGDGGHRARLCGEAASIDSDRSDDRYSGGEGSVLSTAWSSDGNVCFEAGSRSQATGVIDGPAQVKLSAPRRPEEGATATAVAAAGVAAAAAAATAGVNKLEEGAAATAVAAVGLASAAAAATARVQKYAAVLLIQMELCSGKTLRAWLDARGRERASPEFVCGRVELVLARHLMKGIREIHGASLVHRDLKPQNLFVTDCGDWPLLKIGDFGLSRHPETQDMERGSLGTPTYCAPEGGASAAGSADIFSAAIIILELLCPTFVTAMERAEVLEAFRERHALPDHFEGLPDHAKLLKWMAQRSPEARPSAEQVIAELKRLGKAAESGRLLPIHEASSEPDLS